MATSENEDKRRAVMTLLNDSEWSTWSDNAIAKACGVSDKTVTAQRPHFGISEVRKPVERTFTTKHGTTATMNTANIGKTKAEPIWRNRQMQRRYASLSSDDSENGSDSTRHARVTHASSTRQGNASTVTETLLPRYHLVERPLNVRSSSVERRCSKHSTSMVQASDKHRASMVQAPCKPLASPIV